jgi:hypothetical protein
MARFAADLQSKSEARVLDIGGTPDYWEMLAARPRWCSWAALHFDENAVGEGWSGHIFCLRLTSRKSANCAVR